MARVRRLLAWIVLLMLPLQAFSTVSMRAAGVAQATAGRQMVVMQAPANELDAILPSTDVAQRDSGLRDGSIASVDRETAAGVNPDMRCPNHTGACCLTPAVPNGIEAELLSFESTVPDDLRIPSRSHSGAPPEKPPRS